MALSRSEQMSRIRSKNTKPEKILRSALWSKGLRYRLHRKVEGARPDLVFIGARLAVFVDGCQWHGCPQHYVAPRTRTDFWQQKLFVNVNRDERQTMRLQEAGWTVLRIWEHEVWENTSEIVALVVSVLNGERLERSAHWQVFRVEIVDCETDMERRHLRRIGEPDSMQVVEVVRSTRKWSRTQSSLVSMKT